MIKANEFETVNAMIGKSYISAELVFPASKSVSERFENLKNAKLHVEKRTISKIEFKKELFKDIYTVNVTFDNGETKCFYQVADFYKHNVWFVFINKYSVIKQYFFEGRDFEKCNTSKGKFSAICFINNNGETEEELRKMLENKAKECFAMDIENKKQKFAELKKDIEYYENFCK